MEIVSEPLKDWQRKRIFGLLNSIGRDQDWLYSMLPVWCGRNRISEMMSNHGNMVIAALEKLQRKPKCSMPQFNLIMRLKKQKKMNDDGLSRFSGHTTGVIDIFELSVKQASALINGLKNLG